MTFREAMLAAIQQSPNAPARLKKMAANESSQKKVRFPRLWKAMENIVIHKYEKETGIKVGANFDWQTIIQWLVDNLPTILKLISGILLLF